MPEPVAGRTRFCQHEVEQPDDTAPLCPGTLTFGPGDQQAKCDTCGAWEGVNAPRPRRTLPSNEQHEWQAKAIAAGWKPPWHDEAERLCSCAVILREDEQPAPCPIHGWTVEPGRTLSSAEAVALDFPQHHVEWPEDERPTFTCTGDVGAKCRLVCSEDCGAESWPCGQYDGDPAEQAHPMRDGGECIVLLFLNSDDSYLDLERHTGPITVCWEGDHYEWEPSDA